MDKEVTDNDCMNKQGLIEKRRQMEESNLFSLQQEIDELNAISAVQIEPGKYNASKLLKIVKTKNRKLTTQLENRNRLINDYKSELINLQNLCGRMRSEKKEEEEENNSVLTRLNNSLQDKNKMLNNLKFKFEQVNEACEKQSKRFLESSETKAFLLQETSTLKKTIEKQNGEIDILSQKIMEAKKALNEKTEYFHWKVDEFLATRKALKGDLDEAIRRCQNKNEQLIKKDEEIHRIRNVFAEIDSIKMHHQSVVDQLKTKTRTIEKKCKALTDENILLGNDLKVLNQQNERLENNLESVQNEHYQAISLLKINLQQAKEDKETEKAKNESLEKELCDNKHRHSKCADIIKDLDKQYLEKEVKTRNEMESALHDQNIKYQRNFQKLKFELSTLNSIAESHRSCERKIEELESRYKSTLNCMEENSRREAQMKTKSDEEHLAQNNTISKLKNENFKLSNKVILLKQNSKENKELYGRHEIKFKEELERCKRELDECHNTLYEQILITQNLQSERDHGGLLRQQEKDDMKRELSRAKDTLRRVNIEKVILEQNFTKCKYDATLSTQKHSLQEKSIQDIICKEKEEIIMGLQENINALKRKRIEISSGCQTDHLQKIKKEIVKKFEEELILKRNEIESLRRKAADDEVQLNDKEKIIFELQQNIRDLESEQLQSLFTFQEKHKQQEENNEEKFNILSNQLTMKIAEIDHKDIEINNLQTKIDQLYQSSDKLDDEQSRQYESMVKQLRKDHRKEVFQLETKIKDLQKIYKDLIRAKKKQIKITVPQKQTNENKNIFEQLSALSETVQLINDKIDEKEKMQFVMEKQKSLPVENNFIIDGLDGDEISVEDESESDLDVDELLNGLDEIESRRSL